MHAFFRNIPEALVRRAALGGSPLGEEACAHANIREGLELREVQADSQDRAD